jgi:hypothetical protein
MAKNTIAARRVEGKKVFRSKLTRHEIALLAELFASGMTSKRIAARFA